MFLGRVAELADSRQRALDAAYTAHAERFVRGKQTVRLPLAKVAINPLDPGAATQSVADALSAPETVAPTTTKRAATGTTRARAARPHVSTRRSAHRLRAVVGVAGVRWGRSGDEPGCAA